MTFLGKTRNPPLTSLQQMNHPLGICRYIPVKSHRFTDFVWTADERLQNAEIKPGAFSLAICDVTNLLIRIYDPATDEIFVLAGKTNEQPSSQPAALFEFGLNYPRGIIPHPSLPGALFVAGETCVYLIDVAADRLSIFAGSVKEGYSEGERTKSQWHGPLGMAALDRGKDGKSFWTLFVCDRYEFSSSHCQVRC